MQTWDAEREAQIRAMLQRLRIEDLPYPQAVAEQVQDGYDSSERTVVVPSRAVRRAGAGVLKVGT